MKRMNFSNVNQAQSRMHRQGQRSVIAEMDFAEVELRVLAHAAEKRARRCGADDSFDADELVPKDFI